jgi:hypothetical protein
VCQTLVNKLIENEQPAYTQYNYLSRWYVRSLSQNHQDSSSFKLFGAADAQYKVYIHAVARRVAYIPIISKEQKTLSSHYPLQDLNYLTGGNLPTVWETLL